MKPWWKLVRPKQDIIDGESVDLGAYAIHLDQIASEDKNAPRIYLDPKEFFKNTVFTNGMMSVIRHVHNRLSGNTDSGSVIDLNTAFGGGKTHTLVLLYHLFKNGEKVRDWLPKKSLENVVYHILEADIPKSKVITWVGTKYSPNNPDDNGMVTPWGQILGQLGPEAVKIIKPFDKDKTRPDTDTIRKLLDKGEPTLFLFDEILNAMEALRGVEIGETTLNHQFRQFYMNLTNVASSMPRVSIVNSFSKSVGNISDKDEEDLELLLNVAGRVDESIETATGNEISRIIRRRLFEDVEDGNEQKEIYNVIKEHVQWTIQNKDDLVIDVQLGELEEAFATAYPFHPRVLQVFEKKWQGLHSFGRTRGVLRMLSLWLREAYLEAHKHNHKDALITLGMAPMDKEIFANIVYGQMGNRNLAIPINSDVAGDNSWATVLDQQASAVIKKLNLHRQVATTVFFESTGGQKQEFASTGEIRWALCGPNGAEYSDIDTCLKNLENRCHYFRTRNKLHRISTKANLNKLKNTERSSIDDKEIDELIEKELKKQIGKGKDIEIYLFPRYPEDIPDTPTFKLCVLPADVIPGEREDQTLGLAKKIIAPSKRTYKRHLAFLTTLSGRGKMIKIARDNLTYESIIKNISNYQLEDSDRDDLPARVKQTSEELKEEIWNCYRKLYLTNTDGTLDEKDILGLLNRSMSQHGLAAVVEDRLKQHDIITPVISHRVTEQWPPIFIDNPWPLQSLRDNVFQSDKAVRSRLINTIGLKKSIVNWIKNKNVVLVSLDDKGRFDEVIADHTTSDVELSTLITFDNNTGILLPSQVLKEEKNPDKKSEEPPYKERAEKLPSKGSEETPQQESQQESQQGSQQESQQELNVSEGITVAFTIPVKKITSVAMAMSMDFEETNLRIKFTGKPKKGVSDPLTRLKTTIKQNGGDLEE